MSFALDIRTSLSNNVIQRVLIESDLLLDSFIKELGDAARLNSKRTLTCPVSQASQCSVPDIVKAEVQFIMTCLAGTILHDFHSIPENVVNSLHNGLHHIWYISVEI